MVSIEEQLKLQREKQRKQKLAQIEKQGEDNDISPPPMVLGKYRYDTERETYFPMDSKKRPVTKPSSSSQELTSASIHHDVEFRNGVWRSQAFPSLAYLVETCPSYRRRTLQRDAMAGRCLLNSMTVPSVAFGMPSLFSLPEEILQRDIICKFLLRPSYRTFDVAENPVDSRPLVTTIGRRSQIMCRTGLLQRRSTSTKYYEPMDDGFLCLRHLELSHGAGTIHTGGLALADKTVSFHLITFQRSSRVSRFEVQLSNLGQLPEDFALCDDKVMFSPTPHNGGVASFFTLDLGQGSRSFHRSKISAGLPQSRVFCMEADSEAVLSKKCVAMGHRDGQLSVWDTISNHVCFAARPSSESSLSFGNTTSVSWLSNGYQLLTRGAMGGLLLYDIRRTGSISRGKALPSSCSKVGDSSLLWELSVPPSSKAVRSKMALYCRGMVVDPTQTVAIAPLLSPSEDPSLGLWSLVTGQWIGEKQLESPPASSTVPRPANEKPPPFLEVCQKTTPAFTTDEEAGMIRDSAQGNSFGFWFKSGRSVSPTDGTSSALSSGNIYHMTMAGGLSR